MENKAAIKTHGLPEYHGEGGSPKVGGSLKDIL